MAAGLLVGSVHVDIVVPAVQLLVNTSKGVNDDDDDDEEEGASSSSSLSIVLHVEASVKEDGDGCGCCSMEGVEIHSYIQRSLSFTVVDPSSHISEWND